MRSIQIQSDSSFNTYAKRGDTKAVHAWILNYLDRKPDCFTDIFEIIIIDKIIYPFSEGVLLKLYEFWRTKLYTWWVVFSVLV